MKITVNSSHLIPKCSWKTILAFFHIFTNIFPKLCHQTVAFWCLLEFASASWLDWIGNKREELPALKVEQVLYYVLVKYMYRIQRKA